MGKTAVGCSLMAAVPELRWVGVKVSPHDHALDDAVWEETDPGSEKDTGRYLAAGARRAFLVTGEADFLGAVRPGTGESLLVESNRFSAHAFAGERESSLQLMVLGGCVTQWKDSTWERMASADAVVLTGGFPVEQLSVELRWKRIFWLMRGKWGSAELTGFVRGRLFLEIGRRAERIPDC